jgi:putative membrane protein
MTEYLAAQNAALNALAGVFLAFGLAAIRAKDMKRHRALMIAALTTSALFLASYLTRVALYPSKPFAGAGVWRGVYFSILFSHMVLAALVPPLALRALYLASRRRFAEHRRVARIAFPIWMYVSITGVVVYLMLFHLFPGN